LDNFEQALALAKYLQPTFSAKAYFEDKLCICFGMCTDPVSKLNLRQEGVRNLNQTQSVPKQFNSNALDDAGGFEFSGKPTLYEGEF